MITAGGDQEQAVVLRLGTKEFETYSRSLDKRSLGYRFVKRLFDIVFSVFVIAVCILLLPLTLHFIGGYCNSEQSIGDLYSKARW